MSWVAGIQRAINYMENHIKEDLDYGKIAAEANCSSYYFQKNFHILCGMPLGEYIRNRRLSLAGTELIQSEKKIIDLALEYGYENPESFSRAFMKFHGISPSEARKNRSGLRLFSRLSVQIIMKGGNLMDNYNIVEKDAFQVLERVEIHSISREENNNTIPDFWERAHQDGTVKKLLEMTHDKSYIYGICYGNTAKDNQTFEYGIAAKYNGSQVPEGFRIKEIPARTWLVFDCVGPMPQAIQEMFHHIVTEFFPASEYQPTYEFDIEAYSAGTMNAADYQSQIWIPVEKN